MGNPIARVGNISLGQGTHNLPCCPHQIVGTIISGTVTVNIGGVPGALVGSQLVTTCPHCGSGMCIQGATGSLLESTPPHRKNDQVTFFCGMGITVEGYENSTA